MFTFLSRTFKYAFQDLYRNFWLSFITVTVIILALFSLNALILVKVVTDYTLNTIEDKIDVSVFINPGVEENVILDLRGRILGLEQVKTVEYISAEEALNSLKEKHKNNESIQQAVDELSENPLGARLIVQAQSTEDYEAIVGLLNDERYDTIISDKNFEEHTYIIDRIAQIGAQVRTFASILTLLFSIIAIIVVFNTVRIIIYTHREEISIMRLVGATTWFIRMPYIWGGIIYSVLSLLFFLVSWYPIIGFLQPFINELFTEGTAIDIVAYYNVNFLMIFGLQFLALTTLLGIASILATQKYSKV